MPFGVMPDVDALVKERKGMSYDEAEKHYIQTEMLDPLMGGMIVATKVVEIDGEFYPTFAVRSLHGKMFRVIISADDEMNGGGRISFEVD